VAVRTLATVAIAVVTVLALATAADAVNIYIYQDKSLFTSCFARGGQYTQTVDAKGQQVGVCTLPGGGVITCVDSSCVEVTPEQKVASLANQIRASGGRQVKVSKSQKVWLQPVRLTTNANGVSVLKDVVCTGLGGKFFASPDGAVGGCRIPTATVVCQSNRPGNNCAGFADTTKHAVATRKRIQVLLATFSVGGPPGTPSGGGSTATTHGPTTTTRGTTATTQPAPTTTTKPNVIQ